MLPSLKHWQLDIRSKCAYLTLNRPEFKNRLDATTLSELKKVTYYLAEDQDVWYVILGANGDCFSAGVDVSLIGGMIDQEEGAYQSNLRELQSALDVFESLEKPTIAALHGPIIGGGVILALCCDFRIAAENSFFCLPEVKRSIAVLMGTQRISRVIGIANTKELVMLGNSIYADRALTLGLVNEVVPYDQLSNRVEEFSSQFLDLPPLAVGVCKKIIQEGYDLDRRGQDLEIEAQKSILSSDDFKEAIYSFFEKRKPNYRGR